MNASSIGAVALYAGLCSFILFWLTAATGRVRQRERVSIGDGGNPRLLRVMRGHANAIEIIPVSLILLLLLALLGVPLWALHLFGLSLTLGRFLHAMHFIAADAPSWQRGAGMGLSMLALVGAGGWSLVFGLLTVF